MTYYAHSHPAHPEDRSQWEPLEVHLQKVAEKAGEFAAAFGAKDWGYLAGLWHDLGKYQEAFQQRLFGSQQHVEHAGAGAALAVTAGRDTWPLAWIVAGHHAGLANYLSKQLPDALTPLKSRLDKAKKAFAESRQNQSTEAAPAIATDQPDPATLRLPPHVKPTGADFEQLGFTLWVRMIFSALVDADRLCTEAFCTPDAAAQRESTEKQVTPLQDLQVKLDECLDAFSRGTTGAVNEQRRRVLEWCRERSQEERGFFTLCVPTGGGKTLASMSFALRHALKNNMQRVIVAVPYTSIIEQNSGIYADFLGSENILEHHSNVDDYHERGEDEQEPQAKTLRRMACENWAAKPIIVTTNVQLLESLFTHRPGRARKLHNIAGSVIILDEAQCVEGRFLKPILHTLRQLVAHYQCSVVICTATQPAWMDGPHLHGNVLKPEPWGLAESDVTPIIPPEAKLLEEPAFDRVEVQWPGADEKLTLDELAEHVAQEPCALVIVSTKKQARQLAEQLATKCPGETLFHLSTHMCPAHRKETLARIKQSLAAKVPLRVVATNLVEAGVDLDFPVVFRAIAGLDSIAQAAGRANREGKLPHKGKVVVYRLNAKPLPGILGKGAQVTEMMLKDQPPDLKTPAAYSEYFKNLYKVTSQDQKNVMTEVREKNFETVSRLVQLIDDAGQHTVIIPYDEEAKARLQDFRQRIAQGRSGIPALRALQPYTVNVRDFEFNAIRDAVTELEEGAEAHVLDIDLYPKAYSSQFGLGFDDASLHADPGGYIC